MKSADQLQITAELGPRLARFAAAESPEKQALQTSLSYFVDQLASNLGLPLGHSLHVVLSPDESETNDFSLKIDGRQCRLPLPTKVSEEPSPREMARLLAAGIYQNRDLCLKRSLSERIFKEWLPRDQESGAAPDLSGEGFHQLLLGLIRRGFRIDRSKSPVTSAARKPETLMEESVSGASTLTLYLSKEQAAIPSFNVDGNAPPTDDDESLGALTRLMQDGLFVELGILLPNLKTEIDERLEGHEFQLQINDLRLPPLPGLEPDQTLVADTVERLALLNVTGEKAFNPTNGLESAIIRGVKAANTCRQASLTTWGPTGFVILSISAEIRRHAGALLTQDLLEFMMGQVAQVHPALVKAVLTRFELAELTPILRDLLDEEISIGDLHAILEGLLALNGATTADLSKYIVFFPYTLNLCQLTVAAQGRALQADDCSNYVRTFLKRYISHKYTRGQSSLLVYLIDPEIEARLNQIEAQSLNLEERTQLIDGVLNEAVYSPSSTPVILTSIETRRLLRKLIEREFPWLAVLSYQELAPELNIQSIARISWGLRSTTTALG